MFALLGTTNGGGRVNCAAAADAYLDDTALSGSDDGDATVPTVRGGGRRGMNFMPHE